MTSITNPTYKTDGNQFNIEFFKHNDESLSLSTAKKYFVSFFGVNILRGYYYFRNAVISDDQIIGSDVISNGNVVCNKLTSNQIVGRIIKADKIYCDDIISTTTNPLLPTTIYGYFYVGGGGKSLPIIGSDDNILSFCGINLTTQQNTVECLLLPGVKLIFYNSSSTNYKKLIVNKTSKSQMFTNLKLSEFNGFHLYFHNVLKQ